MNPQSDKVFNHQLLNANAAIIGYSGQLDFQLSITQLSVDNVSVGITKIRGEFDNLKQIGYQILLIAFRDIIDIGFVTFIPVYNSQLFMLPVQGIKYNYQSQSTLNVQKPLEYHQQPINSKDGLLLRLIILHNLKSLVIQIFYQQCSIRMPNLKKLVRN
ncbi:unnamed protein product [Paramecium pentaurelia]|uniref:Uncharacterized protein n=1 Tax=Paramecium pentaurelia TaxID=43138 RepID=A0A8S1TGH0_9CILI|nr:unnamed protein product [Paramecium pentaurelia]